MIILDPIAEVVQKTLLEKMRMSGKRTTKVSAPMSKGDGKPDAEGNPIYGANADLSYLSARTIWSRMISLTVPSTKPSSDNQAILAKLEGENINAQVPDKFKPVVISGGQENTKEINPTFQGSNLAMENDLGFKISIPHRAPVSTPWYYGENALPDRREFSMSTYPELFAVDKTMPTYGGIPVIDKNSFAARVSRSRNIIKI